MQMSATMPGDAVPTDTEQQRFGFHRVGKLPDKNWMGTVRTLFAEFAAEAWWVGVRDGERRNVERLMLVDASDDQLPGLLGEVSEAARLRPAVTCGFCSASCRAQMEVLGYQVAASLAEEEAARVAAGLVRAALPRMEEVTHLLGDVQASPGGAGSQLRGLMGKLRPAVEAMPDKASLGEGAVAIRDLLTHRLHVPHLDGHTTRDIGKYRFHVGKVSFPDGQEALATQFFTSRAQMALELGPKGLSTPYDIVSMQQVIDSFDPNLLLRNPGYSVVVDRGSETGWFRLPALLMLLLGQAARPGREPSPAS
jgi:hypothetical protein